MQKKFLLLAALCCSQLLWSQETATVSTDSSKSELDEVVITANKFPQKALNTGKVTIVIDRQTLDRSAGKDLSQLLTEQAGIVVNGATSNPGKDKSLFLRGAANGYSVVLINGIPVNDPSFSGAFDLRLLPLEEIERIEIVKGAQSTLYGSDAVAGVINIITRKPGKKKIQVYGGASAGSYRTRKLNGGVSGTLGFLSYDAVYVHQESEGISEAIDPLGNQNFDKDGYMNNALSVNLDAKLSEHFHLMPYYRRSFFQGGYDGGSFNDDNSFFKSSLESAGAIARLDYTHASVRGSFAYDKMYRNYIGGFGPFPFDGNNKQAEIYGHYNFTDHVKVLAGFDYRYQQNADSSIQFSSPYISFFLEDIQGFNLEAGTRLNFHSKYGNNSSFSINPSYTINDRWKLFVNIASAFKAPSISALYGSFGANPELEPETSMTYEGGVQGNIIKNKLTARAVYFKRRIKNVIAFTNQYENFNAQNDYGFEFEPTLTLSEKITIQGYYAYVNGAITTTGVSGKDSSYYNLLRRPKHSFGITAQWQATPRLFVSGNYYSYGKRTDYDFSSFPSNEVTLGAYGLLNAYAEYRLLSNRLRIFADLKNILNKDFQESWGYATMGRNWQAGFNFRF